MSELLKKKWQSFRSVVATGLLLSLLCLLCLLSLLLLISSDSHQSPREPWTELPLTSEDFVPGRETYDVLVVGSEPEGIAAAIAAARMQKRTLLVDPRSRVGGLLTLGKLNQLDIPEAGGKRHSGGIFREWHRLHDEQYVVDIEKVESTFVTMLKTEPLLDLSLATTVVEPLLERRAVVGIRVQSRSGEQRIRASRVIDATQDAELAAAAGVPYFLGSEDIMLKDRQTAVTPVIHLRGVDWAGVRLAAHSERFGKAVVMDETAYGFWGLLDRYKPVEPRTKLRGLNIGRVRKPAGDEVFINALLIFEVDGLSGAAKAEAMRIGQREIGYVLTFLRANFPGFERASLVGMPEELYVRETRHVKAEYQLPMVDVWRNRDHWDRIGYGGYPVDIQASSAEENVQIVSWPRRYAIPFRSLVPLRVEQLLVVGRSAGFSSVAFGSARVVPTGMVCGEAAGVAAALSIDRQVSFRQLATDRKLIADLQAQLKRQGAYVNPFSENYPYEGEWFDDKLDLMMNLGLLVGGYENDLRAQEPLTYETFAGWLQQSLLRTGRQAGQLADIGKTGERSRVFAANHRLLRDEAVLLMASALKERPLTGNLWGQWQARGYTDERIRERLAAHRELTRAEGIYLLTLALEK